MPQREGRDVLVMHEFPEVIADLVARLRLPEAVLRLAQAVDRRVVTP